MQRFSARRAVHLCLLATAMVGVVCACATKGSTTVDTYSVTDDYDRQVEVPLHPHRIVSTSPAVTEILFALGADSLLVGRTDFCQYPPQAEAIPSIGGISNLNIERIVSLEPDLVISGSMVSRKAAEQADGVGIPMVFVVEKPHFDALYDNILAIGRLVGLEARADSLNARLRQQVDRKLDSVASIKTSRIPSCYYVVGFGAPGNFTAGGNTFINDIIRLAGGRNIAEDIEGWSFSLEALVDQDPDYIILRREDSAAFVGLKPYSSLTAVREGRVVGVESATFDLQIPRNIDAVLYLRSKLAQ